MDAFVVVLIPIAIFCLVYALKLTRPEPRQPAPKSPEPIPREPEHFESELPEPEHIRPSELDTRGPAKSDFPLSISLGLLPSQFIVLDLETTGLNPLRDEIIEFGAIRVTLGTSTHPAFQTLVKPKRKLPPKIVEITGITQLMLDSDGIDLPIALAQFSEFIGDLPIVTFNAEFDMGFIYSAGRQCGIKFENRYTCALKRARRAWPTLPNHKLAYLTEVMGIPNSTSHRALADSEHALYVFVLATSTLNQKVRWSKPPASLDI